MVFLTGLCFAALGLIMTALAPSYDFFMYYFTLFITPMTMLSGCFSPEPAARRGAQGRQPVAPGPAVAQVRPLLLGQMPQQIGFHLAVLALITVLAFWLALALTRRAACSTDDDDHDRSCRNPPRPHQPARRRQRQTGRPPAGRATPRRLRGTSCRRACSVYRWNDAVESATEVPVLIKTTLARYPALQAAPHRVHPYELPEIIAVPLQGRPARLSGVGRRQETTEAAPLNFLIHPWQAAVLPP